jgi:uncharacterized SAM-binding protein YcdF (DUF218 family)
MFVPGKLIWYVAAPGNLLVLLLVAGFVALLLRRYRVATVLTGIATVAALVVVLTPAAQLALAPLEDRFPRTALPAHVDGILLLGGAINVNMSLARHEPTLDQTAERITATAALARRYPDAKIVLSGGTGWGARSDEAEPTRDLLMALGVAADRMVLETRSRNTFENAEDSFALVHPAPRQVWLLITSAFHMPRAMGCFRKIGWGVVPYPVDYHTAPGISGDYFLNGQLTLLEVAMREWVGLAAYYMAGHISRIFPGPQNLPLRTAAKIL